MKKIIFERQDGGIKVIPEDRVEYYQGHNNTKRLIFYSISSLVLRNFKDYLIEAERFPLIKPHRFQKVSYYWDKNHPENKCWCSIAMGASKLSDSEILDILACWKVYYNQIYRVLGEK